MNNPQPLDTRNPPKPITEAEWQRLSRTREEIRADKIVNIFEIENFKKIWREI